MYDIIALENLCFRPSTRTQKARVLKNLHSGERFSKGAFSVTKCVWTVGKTGEKISVFKQDICLDGA